MNSRMPSKVPTFPARPRPGVTLLGSTMFFDLSKLTNEQIEREMAELAVKITELPESRLLKAKLEAKQFLLTAELKSRREKHENGRPSKPTIEEIERELAQVKAKLDEAYGNRWSKGVGELESKRWRLEFERRFRQESEG